MVVVLLVVGILMVLLAGIGAGAAIYSRNTEERISGGLLGLIYFVFGSWSLYEVYLKTV